MQTGVPVAQMIHLQVLDGVQNHGGDQMQPVIHTTQGLQSIQQQRGGCTQQSGGLAGDDTAVGQLHGCGGSASLFLTGQGSSHNLAVLDVDAHLLHQQLQLGNHIIGDLALLLLAQGIVVAADNLLTGGCTAGLVIDNAVANHVDTHVRGGLVGAEAQDLLEHGNQNGECLHVAVVIDGGDAVSFQMEGVDHVDVIQIHGGRFVGQVHGMVQGQIPDGEGLELCIACLNATLMLMIELAHTGGQFAGTGAGCGDNNQLTAGLNVIVSAITVIADDAGNVVGVALDGIVMVHLQAQALQTGLECLRLGLLIVAGQHHAGNIQTEAPENVDQTDHIPVIGDAQVAADLVLLNIGSVDGNDHLHLILQLQQHPQLGIRLEAGQNSGCVIIVIKLAAELQIQLAAELGQAVTDMGGLHLQILIIVKSQFCHDERLSSNKINYPLLY